MPKTIRFKSTQENWIKEYTNLKRNTIRKRDDEEDIRFEILDEFVEGKWNTIDIEIENTTTFETFTRRVTDVTIYEELYIISW